MNPTFRAQSVFAIISGGIIAALGFSLIYGPAWGGVCLGGTLILSGCVRLLTDAIADHPEKT